MLVYTGSKDTGQTQGRHGTGRGQRYDTLYAYSFCLSPFYQFAQVKQFSGGWVVIHKVIIVSVHVHFVSLHRLESFPVGGPQSDYSVCPHPLCRVSLHRLKSFPVGGGWWATK